MKVVAIAIMAAGLIAAGPALSSPSNNPAATRHHAMHGKRSAHKVNNRAIAVIYPTAENDVHGVVHFTTVPGGVEITADLHGLPPDSPHGFHIHEYGDCSAADASSAGGHYNPEHHPHAGPKSQPHHAGDLGNIEADAQGNAHLDLTVHDISVDGRHNPILGRAVIVHENADDLKSQPSGDAGSRIGCGVIGLAETTSAPAD